MKSLIVGDKATVHELDALVLRVAASPLETLGQPVHRRFVAHDQTLHPRLLEIRGWT